MVTSLRYRIKTGVQRVVVDTPLFIYNIYIIKKYNNTLPLDRQLKSIHNSFFNVMFTGGLEQDNNKPSEDDVFICLLFYSTSLSVKRANINCF